MQRQALARLACRMLAYVLGIQALSDAVATFPEFPRTLDGALIALMLIAALGLAFAPAPIERFMVGDDGARRLRAADAQRLVRCMAIGAGGLILLGALGHVRHGASALVVLIGGLVPVLGARALACRLAPPEPEPDPGPAAVRLLGDLAEAAGALGARVAKRVMRSSIDAMIAAVELRKPDFGAATSADGTVTIAFSDMEGFTAMTQRLGDAAAHEVIKDHNQIVRKALKRHGGQEVELQGDGFLLAFPDTAQAVRCAIAIQQACAAHSARDGEEPIRVRIGLHRGTPIQEGDRFFGITVILAARIASQASGAQVLVSQDVHDAVVALDEFRFDVAREAELKGLSGRHRMHPLIWD